MACTQAGAQRALPSLQHCGGKKGCDGFLPSQALAAGGHGGGNVLPRGTANGKGLCKGLQPPGQVGGLLELVVDGGLGVLWGYAALAGQAQQVRAGDGRAFAAAGL